MSVPWGNPWGFEGPAVPTEEAIAAGVTTQLAPPPADAAKKALKYALIAAAVLGGLWLLSNAASVAARHRAYNPEDEDEDAEEEPERERPPPSAAAGRRGLAGWMIENSAKKNRRHDNPADPLDALMAEWGGR